MDDRVRDYTISSPAANVKGDIVIREGSAAPIYDPVKVAIEGTLHAPWQYLQTKTAATKIVQGEDGIFYSVRVYGHENCHLLVEKDKGRITFVGNEKDRFATKVAGVLDFTEELLMFDINEKKYWKRDEMVELFRRTRHHFKDPQKAVDIIKGLRDYTSQVQKMHKNREENAGNVEKSYSAIVEKLSFEVKFELEISIFKDTPKEVFTVEIAVDASGSSLQFYMLSDELFEIEEKLNEEQIAEQIALFQAWGCSIVQVS